MPSRELNWPRVRVELGRFVARDDANELVFSARRLRKAAETRGVSAASLEGNLDRGVQTVLANLHGAKYPTGNLRAALSHYGGVQPLIEAVRERERAATVTQRVQTRRAADAQRVEAAFERKLERRKAARAQTRAQLARTIAPRPMPSPVSAAPCLPAVESGELARLKRVFASAKAGDERAHGQIASEFHDVVAGLLDAHVDADDSKRADLHRFLETRAREHVQRAHSLDEYESTLADALYAHLRKHPYVRAHYKLTVKRAAS